MTLDDLYKTFDEARFEGGRDHGCRTGLAAVMRKRVQWMLEEAFLAGCRSVAWEPSEQIWEAGGGSYTTEKPPTASGYAERIISQIINERSNEEERRG